MRRPQQIDGNIRGLSVERPRLSWVVCVLGVTLCVNGLAGVAAEAKPTRPNILFIIVDDQSALDLRLTTPRRSSRRQTSTGSPAREWCSMRRITWAPSSAPSALLRGT